MGIIGLFETLPEWEIDNPILKLLSGRNVRNYSMIHILLGTVFFILELLIREDDECEEGDLVPWTLHIADLDIAFSVIKEPNVCEYSLSLFVPRRLNDSNEYGGYKIKNIYEGHDDFDRHVKIYECINGKSFTDIGYLKKENEIKNKKLIFQQQ